MTAGTDSGAAAGTAVARFVTRPPAYWLLLAVSLAAHVTVTLLGADPFAMVDLGVYLDGAGWTLDGGLYDRMSSFFSAGKMQYLPFTYPPFAGLAFLTLSWLPVVVVRALWQLACVAALAAIVYLSLRLLGRAGRGAGAPPARTRGVVVTVTALAIWLEPVRTTFNYGQINLFLTALLLAGAVAGKEWVAGGTVGLAAGIKLVPAITGLYYLLQRRWTAVAACVAGFAATVVVGLAVLPAETKRYFTELIFDPARTGPVFNAYNQSWRGALARLTGREDWPAGWLVASAVTLVVGVWALLMALRAADRLGAFVSVQFIGLLVSPISWSHHWVWVLPLLLWTVFGPRARSRWVRALRVGWLLACYSYLVSFLVAHPTNFVQSARPWYQGWLGLVYAALGLGTLVVIGVVNRGDRRRT